jgi:predicted molibdopterin-dependent oxidoreductase YjgC
MSDKIKMSFNGREIETEAGKSLIKLSHELGEVIPHFCYHPGIGVEGNCRLCLVELKGAPKLVPGCTLSTAEGMEVITNSDQVIKARAGVLEFILINHPLDCPICDMGGECPLQDYTREHGPACSRMDDEKNSNVKHKIIGEHVIFDAERCILCTRCVRFLRDVAGREELGVQRRGDHASLTLFDERPLTGNFTGNIVNNCPVGALTAREFRFKARPWEMTRVATSCGGCSLGCAANTWWLKDEVMRLTACADNTVNDWWLCDRGRFEYPESEKIQGSRVRRHGEHVPVDYSEATARAVELLQAGNGTRAVLAGSRSTNEELAAVLELNRNLDGGFSPFPDAGGTTAFLAALKSSSLEVNDLTAMRNFKRVLILGGDPEISHPILALRLGADAVNHDIQVTLVGKDVGPAGGFPGKWERLHDDPAGWLAGAGEQILAGDDDLLVILDEDLVRGGELSVSLIDRLKARSASTGIILLMPGFNRRGMLDMAADGDDLLQILESGKIERLLLFGIDPKVDFTDPKRWEKALGQAGCLIIQSSDLAGLHKAAEVILARRRTVDLQGEMTGTLGTARSLDTWSPVAGGRVTDHNWWRPLFGNEDSEAMEVAGSNEG